MRCAHPKGMRYARIMAVKGPTVDRRTNVYLTERGLERAIAGQIKAMRTPGPYMVERYIDGKRVVEIVG